MTTTWQLICWSSMHVHNNSVLHYLYNMAVSLVIYSKARSFKAKAKSSRPRPRPRNLTLRPRPTTRINIPARNVHDCAIMSHSFISEDYSELTNEKRHWHATHGNFGDEVFQVCSHLRWHIQTDNIGGKIRKYAKN